MIMCFLYSLIIMLPFADMRGEPINGEEFLESPGEYLFVQDCVELITKQRVKVWLLIIFHCTEFYTLTKCAAELSHNINTY